MIGLGNNYGAEYNVSEFWALQWCVGRAKAVNAGVVSVWPWAQS